MTDATGFRSSELAGLKDQLSRLEVTVSQDSAGRFTAFTLSEPLFCFERGSLQEIEDLVADTLRSYVGTFYRIENVVVESIEAPVEIFSLPVEEITPVKRFRPHVLEAA